MAIATQAAEGDADTPAEGRGPASPTSPSPMVPPIGQGRDFVRHLPGKPAPPPSAPVPTPRAEPISGPRNPGSGGKLSANRPSA